jgi:hypothetical protein
MKLPRCLFCLQPDGLMVERHQPEGETGPGLVLHVPHMFWTVGCPRCGRYAFSIREESYLLGMNAEERALVATEVREGNAARPGCHPIVQERLFALCPALCARVEGRAA